MSIVKSPARRQRVAHGQNRGANRVAKKSAVVVRLREQEVRRACASVADSSSAYFARLVRAKRAPPSQLRAVTFGIEQNS